MGADDLRKQENLATKNQVTTTDNKQNQTQATTSIIKPMEDKKYTQAVLTTNKGTIEITFGKTTPNTVENFIKLANSGYYNGVRFHRVIKNFMIQTGDPLSKDSTKVNQWGTGGPGYTFKDELTGQEQYSLGTVAMANAGPNTNGSQFFIVTADPSVPLPPNYTVFGKVTKGIETALTIQNVKTTGNGTVPADKPLEDVIIDKIELR
jgi:peptidylprolyl isomerase